MAVSSVSVMSVNSVYPQNYKISPILQQILSKIRDPDSFYSHLPYRPDIKKIVAMHDSLSVLFLLSMFFWPDVRRFIRSYHSDMIEKRGRFAIPIAYSAISGGKFHSDVFF